MGDEADWIIEQMIWGEYDFEEEWEPQPKRTATEVAEQLLKDKNKMKGAKKLNDGVIKW